MLRKPIILGLLALSIFIVSFAIAETIIRTQKPAIRGTAIIRVQYADGYPKSGIVVRKIYPEPIVVLGTTNESGLVTSSGLLGGPQNYVVDAWYGANAVLSVDGNGVGNATIRANFEISPPIVDIVSPEDQNYTRAAIPLDCTFRDYSAISWAGYSIDEQANITMSADATLTNLSTGSHSLIVYSNDTFGNMGSSQIIHFSVQATWQISQSGIDSDFAGTVVVIDDLNYSLKDLPFSPDWSDGSTHTFAFQSPLVVTENGKQYMWVSTSGLSTSQNGSITVSTQGEIVADYATQYYLKVDSEYGRAKGSGWYNNTTVANAILNTGIVDHGNATRRVFVGWSGDTHGSNYAQSNDIAMNGSRRAVANWKTQHYLTVNTDPSGIVSIEGEGWYDSSAIVSLTAPLITEYEFGHWNVDGVQQATRNVSATIIMDAAHNATARYSAWSMLHDIAVSNVTTSKTGISLPPTVGQGYTITMNATFENEGNSTETFNVTVYANTTILGTFTNITLAPEGYASSFLTWNTTGFAKGNYMFSVHAWPVQNETNTTDNTYNTWVVVTIPGDINGDLSVDLYDALLLAGALNSNPTTPYWNPNADVNSDVAVDVYDALVLAGNYGRKV